MEDEEAMIHPKILNGVVHELGERRPCQGLYRFRRVCVYGCRLGSLGLAILAAVGCKYSSVPGGELFMPEQTPRNVDYVTAAQSAAGARADAMLYFHHFDGSELNSLGRAKLHLMVMDKPESQPLVVYLNVPREPLVSRLRISVQSFLEEQGLLATDFQIEQGVNWKMDILAADSLSRMIKTENPSQESQRSATATGSEAGTRGQPPTSR